MFCSEKDDRWGLLRFRSGIKLPVVIAIIAIELALIWQAVQQAREEGRPSQSLRFIEQLSHSSAADGVLFGQLFRD